MPLVLYYLGKGISISSN